MQPDPHAHGSRPPQRRARVLRLAHQELLRYVPDMAGNPDRRTLLAAEVITRFAVAALEGRDIAEADFGDNAVVDADGRLVIDGQVVELRDVFGGGMRILVDAIRLVAEARDEDPVDVARTLLRETQVDVSLADVDLG
jgi:hypothetical protein